MHVCKMTRCTFIMYRFISTGKTGTGKRDYGVRKVCISKMHVKILFPCTVAFKHDTSYNYGLSYKKDVECGKCSWQIFWLWLQFGVPTLYCERGSKMGIDNMSVFLFNVVFLKPVNPG